MASAALLAVLGARALEASKVAQAAERRAPRAGGTRALRTGPSPVARPTRGPQRFRRGLLASPSTTVRPRP
jgi:hypothetical protein